MFIASYNNASLEVNLSNHAEKELTDPVWDTLDSWCIYNIFNLVLP